MRRWGDVAALVSMLLVTAAIAWVYLLPVIANLLRHFARH